MSDLKLKAFEVPDISLPSGMHSQSRGIKRIFAAAMDTANDKAEGAKLTTEELIEPICKNEHGNVTENQNMALNTPVDHMVSYYACLVSLLCLLFCKSFQSSNLKAFRFLLIS